MPILQNFILYLWFVNVYRSTKFIGINTIDLSAGLQKFVKSQQSYLIC